MATLSFASKEPPPCRVAVPKQTDRQRQGGGFLIANMKNGKALRGHRRILKANGKIATSRRAPLAGWDLGCICGWNGGKFRIRQPAQVAYREHLDTEIEKTPRQCKQCGELKKPSEMAERYSRHICRSCYSKMGNDWGRKHPRESARHKRNHHLLKKFGITADQADALLVAQGGVCAICQIEISDRRGYSPHIDHDHGNGSIRGVLCFACNSGLGHFKDDIRTLRSAIRYLEQAQRTIS